MGVCRCGCGRETPLARNTDRRSGLVKGHPVRYILGHQTRTADRRITSLVDRFWAKVLKSDDPDGCWTWIGGRTSQDYGAIRAGGRGSPMIPAHCLSYEIHKGARGDRFVCHSCDNPSCVNPAHLWLGTNSENILDAANKGRAASGRTRHNHVTLNPDAVREIRRRYAAGEKQRDIAAGYGVKQACVWRAIHRFTWRYID